MNVFDVTAAVLVLSGSLLALTAAIGVVRFPDTLSRMHAATKPQVLGLLLVLTGAGRAFSAGGDIEHMQQVIDEPELFLNGIPRAKHLIHSILDCPKPIIAKVNGPARS